MNLKMMENNTDTTISIEEPSKSLKETLRAQQQLLQKLYNELDVEREASSSAASEALAMILRLQGEKASVKMESEHYKRLAEEKMCYAEESMNIFEEQIHQREMEIASLDCQLQAYRYKLQSLGFVDNETSSLSRRNSAPPKLLKLAYLYRNRSTSPDSDLGEDEIHQNADSERQSYWDQIRKLDKIVEEMTDDEHIKLSGKSSHFNEIEQVQNVHDVFEVPEINNDVKGNGKLIMEGESKFEKVLVFPEEAISMLVLKQKDKEVFLPRGDVAVDCHMAVVEGPSQQVNTTTMEITEECEVEDEGKKQVLRLLHEINEKLDSIKSEIKNGNTKIKKPSSNYDLPMLQLQEAMLHFWL